MNEIAAIGHNRPPADPETQALEGLQSEYDSVFIEVNNWLDGTPVTTEAQMEAVNALLASVKEAETKAAAAKETEYRPHKAGCDKVIARWKPFLTDLDRQRNGLIAAVDVFKRKLAAEKAEAEQIARRAAEKAMQVAHDAARLANPADIEAVRAADAAKLEAEIATARARAASKDTVKGMRTYTDYVVLDGRELAAWVWRNDRPALDAWLADYATKHKLDLPGIVDVRAEKRAV